MIAVSTGTTADPGDGSDWRIWALALLIPWVMPNSYRDIIGLARVIRGSPLDWTMVRVAFLNHRPVSSAHLNVGLYGHTRHSLSVSRAKVAEFMFDQVSSQEFVRGAPGLSTGRPD